LAIPIMTIINLSLSSGVFSEGDENCFDHTTSEET
jgi:hypothetical protein